MSKYLLRSAMAVSLAAVALAFAVPARAEEKAPKAEKPKAHDFTGTIESTDAAAGTVTVKNRKDETKTFTCDAACKYRTNDKKDAAMSDFKVGDKVRISYTEEDGKMVCHRMEQPKPKKDTEKKPE